MWIQEDKVAPQSLLFTRVTYMSTDQSTHWTDMILKIMLLQLTYCNIFCWEFPAVERNLPRWSRDGRQGEVLFKITAGTDKHNCTIGGKHHRWLNKDRTKDLIQIQTKISRYRWREEEKHRWGRRVVKQEEQARGKKTLGAVLDWGRRCGAGVGKSGRWGAQEGTLDCT